MVLLNVQVIYPGRSQFSGTIYLVNCHHHSLYLDLFILSVTLSKIYSFFVGLFYNLMMATRFRAIAGNLATNSSHSFLT